MTAIGRLGTARPEPEPWTEDSPGAAATVIVEMFGLPGAGKSTVAREVINELRAAGLRVEDDDLPPLSLLARVGRYARFAKFCAARLRLLAAVTRYAAAIRPWSATRAAFAWEIFVHAFGRLEAKRRGADAVILSQGALQASWSVGVRGSIPGDEMLGRMFEELARADSPTIVAEIDLAASDAAGRVARRRGGGSRFDGMPASRVRVELQSMSDLAGRIARNVRDRAATRFVRLDAALPASRNGRALTRMVLELRSARRGRIVATKRRIALFVPDLTIGGAERVMVNLCRGFLRRGLDVDLLLVRREGIYLPDVPVEVRIVTLGGGRTIFAIPALARYLRRERPMALLATLTYANVVAIIAGRLARGVARIVVREANSLTRETAGSPGVRARVLPLLARWSYRSADEIVAVSAGAADSLVAATGMPRARIHVLDNPIVTDELPLLAAAAVDHPWFTKPDGVPVIVAAGRLTAQKDFPTLIRAFAGVRAHRPARLVILGDGELRGELSELAATLGVDADLSLPGMVRNPFAYMARASVFALSSAWEGSPGVLIQAMACGAPVVSTDCESGPREILRGGEFGALVPVGDVESLAGAISDVLAGPRRSPPEASWRRFSLDASVDAYLRVLAPC